jgi:uncharacterized membrane protein
MNQAHFHLMVNHLPIIFPMVGAIVLIGGFTLRSEIIKRVAYSIFILGAIATLPAFLSGEGAEEVVENLPDVSESFIEPHEDIAKIFALLSYALGAFSILALWSNWQQKSFKGIVSVIVLLLSVVVLYFGKATGTTGGEIRHTEIRANQTPRNQPLNGVDANSVQEEEDED